MDINSEITTLQNLEFSLKLVSKTWKCWPFKLLFCGLWTEDEFQNEIIRNGDVNGINGCNTWKSLFGKGLNRIVLQNYRVGRFEPIIKQKWHDKRIPSTTYW